MGDVVFFYDRRYWPSMMHDWTVGEVTVCPPTVDPMEWRTSARRLARQLGCHVRTGLRPQANRQILVAEANDGYPLGLIDPYERADWLRSQCNGCEALSDG